jgi:ferredoxin
VAEYFISTANFDKFVEKLLENSKVIAPVEEFEKFHLQEIALEDIPKIKLFGFRTVESLKSYFFRLTEKVSRYFGKDEGPKGEQLIILGARGCDLEALEVLDRVFTEGDFKDPFYIANREKVTIIGADCTDVGDTCFCTLVRGKPYPVKLFDISLSPQKNGYVVEAGTEKGNKLIDASQGFFSKIPQAELSERNKNREKIIDLLAKKNKDFSIKLDLTEIHKRSLENKAWKILTKDCVECSACNFACPSCTCFLLLDQEKNKESERYKIWDACLKAGYAGVAGGANPRGQLYQRLQNRYHCKFDYSFDRLGRFTCVGCGRCCVDGCAGKIDMRKVFVELEKQVPLTAKLK